MVFAAKIAAAVALLWAAKICDLEFFQTFEHPQGINFLGSALSIAAFCMLVWGFK